MDTVLLMMIDSLRWPGIAGFFSPPTAPTTGLAEVKIVDTGPGLWDIIPRYPHQFHKRQTERRD